MIVYQRDIRLSIANYYIVGKLCWLLTEAAKFWLGLARIRDFLAEIVVSEVEFCSQFLVVIRLGFMLV